VIVPAYNEAAHIADTVRSVQEQTRPPQSIVVVDDCSDDGTGEIARSLGATVLRPPTNTGSKAGAQNFALDSVRTDFVMVLDADTTLDREAIAKVLPAFEDTVVPPRAVMCCRGTWRRCGSGAASWSTCSPSRSPSRSRTSTAVR